jgi:hypothetical protein
MIVEDTINLLERVTKISCRRFLSKLGIKGYYNLNEFDVKNLLRNELRKEKEEIVLEFYESNKIKLDMFKYEVTNTLKISNYEFNEIKGKLKVSGVEVVNINKRPKHVLKYDRKCVYEIKEKLGYINRVEN